MKFETPFFERLNMEKPIASERATEFIKKLNLDDSDEQYLRDQKTDSLAYLWELFDLGGIAECDLPNAAKALVRGWAMNSKTILENRRAELFRMIRTCSNAELPGIQVRINEVERLLIDIERNESWTTRGPDMMNFTDNNYQAQPFPVNGCMVFLAAFSLTVATIHYCSGLTGIRAAGHTGNALGTQPTSSVYAAGLPGMRHAKC
jgi:hypothetical protein